MSQLTDATRFAFHSGTGLSKSLKSYMYSADQEDYALKVADTLENFGTSTAISLLEADPGIGKSLAYLVPLLLHAALTGERVAISTFTLQLQHQLIDKDIRCVLDVVESITGVRLSVAPRKGMRNFVSQSKVEAVYNELISNTDSKQSALLERFKSWSESTESGDIREWLEMYGDLPNGVQHIDICLEKDCPDEDHVLYRKHVGASKDADVVVITHIMLLMHSMYGYKLLDAPEDEGGREIQHVVIDEADRLATAAESLSRKKMSLHMIASFLTSIMHIDTVAIVEILKTIDAFSEQLKNFQFKHNTNYKILDDAFIFKKQVSDHVISILHDLKALDKKKLLSGSDKERLLSTIDSVKLIAKIMGNKDDVDQDQDDKLSIMYSHFVMLSWSPVYKLPAIEAVLLEPSKAVSKYWRKTESRPFGRLKSCILTSASLSVPGAATDNRFMSFMGDIGLYKAHHNVVHTASYEHANFGKAQFVFASPDLTGPLVYRDDEDEEDDYRSEPDEHWLTSTVSMILSAAEQGGRVLVLTNSFSDVDHISALLESHQPSPVFVHQKGTKLQTLLTQFVAEHHAILITPAGWEGLDLPGLLSHIVIPRIPFSPPDKAYNNIYARYLTEVKGMNKERAKQIIFTRNLDHAKRKLKQGMGRGIRQQTDEVTYWFGDPRFPMPDELRDKHYRRFKFSRKQYAGLLLTIATRFRNGVFSSVSNGKIFDGENNLI